MPLDTLIALIRVEDAMREIDAPEEDYTIIESLVNEASARLEAYCSTILRARSVTKLLDGTGDVMLDLGARIITVDSVTVGGTPLVPGTDFIILHTRGELYRAAGWSGIQAILVTATLGYDEASPEGLAALHVARRACMTLVRERYHRRDGDLQSERIGDYAYTRFAPINGADSDMPADVQTMMAPYRRLTVI